MRINLMQIHNTGITQVRSEEEGSQEEDAENLRNRLISRQAELAIAQEKIQEILTEKEMLRWDDFIAYSSNLEKTRKFLSLFQRLRGRS